MLISLSIRMMCCDSDNVTEGMKILCIKMCGFLIMLLLKLMFENVRNPTLTTLTLTRGGTTTGKIRREYSSEAVIRIIHDANGPVDLVFTVNE
jgi:hypothetical protein